MTKSLIITDKKQILLRDDHPTRITTLIPSARIIDYKGIELVVVPHELDEVRVLNNMGYGISSPVSHYYSWAGRYTPFYAQLETVDKLTLNTRMFVLNSMGLGKTLSALWAYDYLRKQGLVKRMLVVTPLSTMERVWADEVFNHFPHLETTVLYGSAARRVAQLEYLADIYIINHDGIKVPEIKNALMKRDDIDIVIIDELASFRNANTDRWKSLRKLLDGRKYVWGMTGTPIPNRPTDAWAQCRLIAPSRVPPYFGRFREMVERKVSMFKWVPRDNALEIVREAMQPAVLFNLADIPEAELPPTIHMTRHVEMSAEQLKAYKQMMTTLVAEAKSGQLMAVNEAVKASKLVQVACIARNTEVLVDIGWVMIQNVTCDDLVWDGIEWVRHDGVILKGVRPVVDCGGVYMTPDHLALTSRGWQTAEVINHAREKSSEFGWPEVRIPDSVAPSWYRCISRGVMGMFLRLRRKHNCESTEPTRQSFMALRVPEGCPRHDKKRTLQYMVGYEAKVCEQIKHCMERLWRTWYNSVCRMGKLIHKVLGGYEGWIHQELDPGSNRQQPRILKTKLPMGNYAATVEQHASYDNASDSSRRDVTSRHSEILRNRPQNTAQSCHTKRVVGREGGDKAHTETEVYDIVNCGPRNRFVVRGTGGELRIVHNCGVGYNQQGECVYFDGQGRIDVLKEVIEESAGKVIVFVPLTGALEMVAAELRKTWHVEVVNGEVGKTERDRIFGEFMRPGRSHVLVAHPGCMAHGLSLVEANTIIWYIPSMNHETYVQANGRITRPGQKRNTLIMHLEGSEIERRMYKRLQGKSSMQNLLLDMIKSQGG